MEEWKAAAKWRGKEVARRHREMAEGVWGKCVIGLVLVVWYWPAKPDVGEMAFVG